MQEYQIAIDDEVMSWLKSEAIPFVDTTPNSVLRRLANLNGQVNIIPEVEHIRTMHDVLVPVKKRRHKKVVRRARWKGDVTAAWESVERYRAGLSLNDAAKPAGHGASWLKRFMLMKRLPIRPKGHVKGRPAYVSTPETKARSAQWVPRATEEQIQVAIANYNSGMTLGLTGASLKPPKSAEWVRRILHARGVPVRGARVVGANA